MPILVTLVLIIIVIIVIGLSSHSNHSNIVHDDSHRRSRDMTTTYTVSDKETGKVLASATIKGNSEFYALDKLLFEEEDKLSFECTTAAGMKRHLEIMETAYQKSMHTIPSYERSYYEKMMKEACETYETQLKEEKYESFQKQSAKDLSDMATAVEEIRYWDFKTCDRGESNKRLLTRLRTKLLENGEKMGIRDLVVSEISFYVDLPESTIMNELAFTDYLQPFLLDMKEEGNRKKRLTELIIKAIPEEGNIKRSELMRQMQSTMDPGELKICFNQAIERKRLREEKIGNSYYVSKPAKSKINYTNEL